MIKQLFLIFSIFVIGAFCPVAKASITENDFIIQEQSVQNRLDDIGTKILNANKIDKRVVFAYSQEDKKSRLKVESTLLNRQVILYQNEYKFIDNDDEMAAFAARGIVYSMRSYPGLFNGYLNSLQMKVAPKKLELVADKRAVDFMVSAGYNPLGLITFIHKSCPQKRFDRFSSKNLTSKRLAVIYEHICNKYPYFLAHNTYLKNPHYQNFLLTSIDNRRMLLNKIKTGSKEELKYE